MTNPTTAPAKTDCVLIRGGKQITGKQGLDYTVGISAESAGASGIHMQMLTMPPSARAKIHKHATHETAIYAVTGASGVWHGEQESVVLFPELESIHPA